MAPDAPEKTWVEIGPRLLSADLILFTFSPTQILGETVPGRRLWEGVSLMESDLNMLLSTEPRIDTTSPLCF